MTSTAVISPAPIPATVVPPGTAVAQTETKKRSKTSPSTKLNKNGTKRKSPLEEVMLGVNRPAMRRLARRAGAASSDSCVCRMSHVVYLLGRSEVEKYVDKLALETVALMEHSCRSTILLKDVDEAINAKLTHSYEHRSHKSHKKSKKHSKHKGKEAEEEAPPPMDTAAALAKAADEDEEADDDYEDKAEEEGKDDEASSSSDEEIIPLNPK
jgi:histone H3/H4